MPSVTPHIPLASIATGSASAAGVSGEYNHEDITDYRGRAFLSIAGLADRAVTDIKRAHMTVEENTAGVGSPNILTADESRKVLSNEGSAATNYHTLPTAAAGLSFMFSGVDASDLIRIVAAAGDKIRLAGEVTIAAGYIESTAQGDAILLVAVDEEYWLATSFVGTWNVETS